MSWTGFKKAVTRAGQSVAVKTVDKAVDGEFEQQDRCYKMLKTSGLNLQKSIRDYSNTLLQLTASQVNIAEIVSNLRQDTNPSQNSNVEIYYSQVVKEINEETIKSIDRPFKETVMDPVNKFANYFIDIDEAIKKRAHKKIDYEQCRAKVRKLIDKPPKDANKLPIAQKELQTAKKIYEEINEQLKNELPQLIALRVPFLEPSFESVVKFQLRFVTDAYSRLAHLQQYLDPKLREEYAGGLLDGQIDDMIAQMNQLGIAQISK